MACLIIAQATIRIIADDNFHNFTGFCLTIYLYVFAIAIAFIEFNWLRARIWFYFMNFSLGKCFFYLVIALLCFGAGAEVSWFDILCGVIFSLVVVLYMFLYAWFRNEEPAYVQKLIEQMEERANAPPPPAAAQININV